MMQTTIDQRTFTIAPIERRLPVSRAVFDTSTKPEQIAEWWDPTGAPLVTCEIDLTPAARSAS